MKTFTLSKAFLAFVLMWSSITCAGNYIYSDLQMKTYDEMQSDVKVLITEAERVADNDIVEAKSKLQDALRLIFSRPNTDNMVSKLVPAVRTPLRNIEAYETMLKEITDTTITMVKNKKTPNPNVATGIIILENIMGEIKPDEKNNKILHNIFVAIRDAQIEVTEKVKNELRMRAMINLAGSPSDVAKKIIGHAK